MQGDYETAITHASKVLEFHPDSYEALWAMGKSKREFSEIKDGGDISNIKLLESALIDLREAIKFAPQNLELHRYTIRVKEELDKSKHMKGQGDKTSMPCGNKEYQDKTSKDVSAT